MAKVSKLDFILNKERNQIPVNCNSKGEFYANIPKELAEQLRIGTKIESDTLKSLEVNFYEKLENYKKSTITHEFFIIIAFQARGEYMKKMDGSYLFSPNNDKYFFDNSFSDIQNGIGLDFDVALKETIDGNVKWYYTELNSKNEYVKGFGTIGYKFINRAKIIPFNQEALVTLNKAQDNFKTLSKKLYDFISLGEDEIMLNLSNKKLLLQ